MSGSTHRVFVRRLAALVGSRGGRATCALLVWLVAFALPALAQRQRPQLLQPQRSQYAGRILLLPFDGHPVSWKLPRMMARLADHELLYPPRELLGNGTRGVEVARVIAWAKKQDFEQLNGVIVALDALAPRDAKLEGGRADAAFLHWLRQRKPGLPIYGFTARARDAVGEVPVDDLLLVPDNREAAYLEVARLLARSYRRPLKVSPVLATETTPDLQNALASRVEAVGGQLVAAEQTDIFLFLFPPAMTEAQTANFAEALAKALAAGYYVALADVSGNPEPLLTALRARKQLDALQAYAAAAVPSQAIGKVLAHASARLIAAKALRHRLEPDQWQRAERMHVELMLTRYLEDWAYPNKVRPLLEAHIREQHADPANLGTANDAAEAFESRNQIGGGDYFAPGFGYNVHGVLLADGTRADFNELLQRFAKRACPLQRTDEVELDVGVHLPQLVESTRCLREGRRRNFYMFRF
ncbi:MAG: DUF4127 family protein [Blastocatellia bacterium]